MLNTDVITGNGTLYSSKPVLKVICYNANGNQFNSTLGLKKGMRYISVYERVKQSLTVKSTQESLMSTSVG